MYPLLSFIAVFKVAAPLYMLPACLSPPTRFAAQAFPRMILILSTLVMQQLTSILIPSSLSIVYSGTVSLLLLFRRPMHYNILRKEYI